MNIFAIKEAIESFKTLYIGSREVEITFFDELTETIEVKYKDNNMITFVTKGSLRENCNINNRMIVDELLILKYREGKNV